MNGLNFAACTIVSKNYFAYARSLAQSFKQHHNDLKFFILIVDSDTEGLVKSDDYIIISVVDLPLKGFLRLAFKFDILEFNTNVKPTFISYLLNTYELSKIIYIDPDIYIFAPLDEIYERLETNDIVVTPHILSKILDNKKPIEIDFLNSGIFNLGFVGVANRNEGIEFLSWWEDRCLHFGFDEPRDGFYVDQKWVNLAPCFFQSLYIHRHPGCNIAYWNLHERTLAVKDGEYWVNTDHRLIFYHFSGIDLFDEGKISKHLDNLALLDRPDLREIFSLYRSKLKENNHAHFAKYIYSYGNFNNGVRINSLIRRLFSEYEEEICDANPFDANGTYFKWLNSKKLLSDVNHPLSNASSRNYNKNEIKFKLTNKIMLLIHRLIGTGRYLLLLKYMSFISRFKNQKEVFKYHA